MRKKRILFLILWICSLIGISWYGGAVSYSFFFALTLLPVLSFVYLMMVFLQFKIYQKLDQKVMVCRQPVTYQFYLENQEKYSFAGIRIRLFSSFSTVEELPEDTEMELVSGEQYRFETKLICRYRGEYEVGVKEVELTDFLHLFTFRYKYPGTIRTTVAPRILQLQQLPGIREVELIASRESLFRKEELTSSVRDYREGDSLRQIHWKATAREQKLKVRELTGTEGERVVICMDSRRPSDRMHRYLPLENQKLELLLGLVHYFAERQIPTELYDGKPKDQGRRIDNLSRFDAYYQEMIRFSFGAGEKPEDLLRKPELQNRKVLFWILHEITDEFLKIINERTAEGTVCICYLIGDGDYDDILKKSNDRCRIWQIGTETDLEGVL